MMTVKTHRKKWQLKEGWPWGTQRGDLTALSGLWAPLAALTQCSVPHHWLIFTGRTMWLETLWPRVHSGSCVKVHWLHSWHHGESSSGASSAFLGFSLCAGGWCHLGLLEEKLRETIKASLKSVRNYLQLLVTEAQSYNGLNKISALPAQHINEGWC